MTKDRTIATEIRSEREALGLSQAELAARCGVDQTTISKAERDQHEPRLSILHKIAAGIGKKLIFGDRYGRIFKK